MIYNRSARRRPYSGWCLLIAVLLAVPSIDALACTVSASGVNFGAFDPLENVNVDSTGNVTVTCSPAASYTLELGAGAAGSYSPREMIGPGGRTMAYNLYLNASRTIVWGDESSGSSTVGGDDDGSGQSHTIYGRIPSGQNPYVGSYSDSIVVTVVF